MAFLDDLVETTQASLPGQDLPEPAPVHIPSLGNATASANRGMLQSEAHLAGWRTALDDEIKARATKCLMDTFDRRNACGKGSSAAMVAARTVFAARVASADQAGLFEMLKWADPTDTHTVYQAFEVVAARFATEEAPNAPVPRNRGAKPR